MWCGLSREVLPKSYLIVQAEINLLNRARALDEAALTEIHERYYTAVYRYISFRISDPHTVEDLASEVFTRFLSALRSQHSLPNTIQGWLYGTAAHVVKEQYRKQKRTNETVINDSLPDFKPLPEQTVAENMRLDQMRSALDELTEDQQHILALRFGQGMPIKDVAETVNKSEGSVKMLQVRAIAALTRIMHGAEVNQ